MATLFLFAIQSRMKQPNFSVARRTLITKNIVSCGLTTREVHTVPCECSTMTPSVY